MKKNNWTQEQLDYLKANYGKIPVAELKEKLRVGQSTIYRKARELGLCKTFLWTPEKIEILKQNYATASWEELFKLLGTTNKDGIIHKAYKLGISRDIYKWSSEQLNYLIQNYHNFTAQELSQTLGKTQEAIVTKAYKLGLTNHPWTPEEEQKLKELYPIHSNKYLAENVFIGRKPEAIRTKALKMGLHKSKDKNNKSFYDCDLIISQLIDVSIKIGRTPLYSELTSLGLPSEKTFCRMFGSYRKAVQLAGLPINAKLFNKNTVKYASDGTICYSTGELVITEFLIKNNIKFEKDPFYKDYCQDANFGSKKADWRVDNYFIEFFGFAGRYDYDLKTQTKIELCLKNNINLIELYPNDINNLSNKLNVLIKH